MSQEEIRKLLGGYATNTLTESERKALFEAALDDQELFDALQQEEALKTALADPGTRAQIREALELQPRGRPAWPMRWWTWSGAAAAVAAAAVLFFVFRQSPSGVKQQSVEVASNLKAPGVTAPPQEAEQKTEEQTPAPLPPRKKLAENKAEAIGSLAMQNDRTAVPAAAPPPIAPAPAPRQAQSIEQAAAAPATATASASPPATAARAAVAQAAVAQTAGAQTGTARDAGAQTAAVQNAGARAGAAPATATPSATAPAIAARAGAAQAAGASTTGALATAAPGAGGRDVAPANAPAANTFGTVQMPVLRYSLFKRDGKNQDFTPVSEADLKPGDLVRFQVLTTTPGNLILLRLDESGEWQRIAEAAAQVKSPNNIPGTPIQVEGNARRYRLTLETQGPQAKTMRAAVTAQSGALTQPTLEITLQGKP